MTESKGSGRPQGYCSNCGDPVRTGNEFCTSCGKQISTEIQDPDQARTSPFLDDFITENKGQIRKRVDSDRLKQNARRLYEEASARYRNWREARATERERTESLRSFEHEREARRSRFRRYVDFFEQASSGSRNLSDWWQAYQDEESGSEQSTTSNHLLSALSRAEAGLNRMREMEGTFSNLLEGGEFEKADSLLDGMRAGQEDFEGEESVFVPLVAVHDRVKQLDGWTEYRIELEQLIKDLEDLLDSPVVKTAAANRVRFPDPHRDTGGGLEMGPRTGSEHVTERIKNVPAALVVAVVGVGMIVVLNNFTAALIGIAFAVSFILVIVFMVRDGNIPTWLSATFLVSLVFGVLTIILLSSEETDSTDRGRANTLRSTLEAGIGGEIVENVKVSGSKATVIVSATTPGREAKSVCNYTQRAASTLYRLGGIKSPIQDVSVRRSTSLWSTASC